MKKFDRERAFLPSYHRIDDGAAEDESDRYASLGPCDSAFRNRSCFSTNIGCRWILGLGPYQRLRCRSSMCRRATRLVIGVGAFASCSEESLSLFWACMV